MTIGARIKSLREKKNISQTNLAKYIHASKQTVFKYENDIITNIPMDKIKSIASILGVSPSYLMGWENESNEKNLIGYDNISAVSTQHVPMLGYIACGKPIYANEDRESYVLCGTRIKADFCLTCKGDSMIGAGIHDGSIVFCRKQDIVNNGEIAAIIIGDEVTLKRFYYYPEKAKLVLQSENPKYEPFVYVKEELNEIKVLGKAIAYQNDIR